MDTTHDHGQMTTTDPHAGHLTTTDPHAGHLTTTDPHAGHHTTTDPHAGHHTTTDPHAGHYTTTGHDHGGTSSEHSMVMFMHGGYNEYIVFHEWKINSVEALIGTCFGLFFISVGYEALKFARDKITNELRKDRKIQATYNEKQLRIDDGKKPKESYFKRMLSLQHVIQTLFHVVQFFIAYFLMLSVMTYNYWICMSILLGIAAGFFFFGVRRSNIDLNEDCGCH